jgi:hypothetical protein
MPVLATASIRVGQNIRHAMVSFGQSFPLDAMICRVMNEGGDE